MVWIDNGTKKKRQTRSVDRTKVWPNFKAKASKPLFTSGMNGTFRDMNSRSWMIAFDSHLKSTRLSQYSWSLMADATSWSHHDVTDIFLPRALQRSNRRCHSPSTLPIWRVGQECTGCLWLIHSFLCCFKCFEGSKTRCCITRFECILSSCMPPPRSFQQHHSIPCMLPSSTKISWSYYSWCHVLVRQHQVGKKTQQFRTGR